MPGKSLPIFLPSLAALITTAVACSSSSAPELPKDVIGTYALYQVGKQRVPYKYWEWTGFYSGDSITMDSGKIVLRPDSTFALRQYSHTDTSSSAWGDNGTFTVRHDSLFVISPYYPPGSYSMDYLSRHGNMIDYGSRHYIRVSTSVGQH